MFPKKTAGKEQPRRKRRIKKRRRKSQPQVPSFSEIRNIFVLLLNPKKRRRRRKKRSLGKRIYRSWLKFAQNVAQWNQKLLAPRKRRRRRRRKQYSVYVMSNQKKVD